DSFPSWMSRVRVPSPALKSRGGKTAAELAGKFQVYPSQVVAWKRQLLEQAPGAVRRRSA
ncbi:MAG TPA: hypothetical protein VN699_20380, partial [Pirellulales bacterium]|nr:hypothetical protein [Pirellulales bacterium]